MHASRPGLPVGVTLALPSVSFVDGGAEAAARFTEAVIDRPLREMGSVGDFVGVQNYTELVFEAAGVRAPEGDVTEIGVALVPGSLASACRHAAEPILIAPRWPPTIRLAATALSI